MNRYLTIAFALLIVVGCYIGVRYLGSVIHYACAVPLEDCPPPLYGLGQLGWLVTGGSFVPFWTRG